MPRPRPKLFLAILLLGGVAHAARPYRGGVVASPYPQASAAALEILDKGGNAVDAAVAAAFAAGVVGPYHNGIGGGGFALVARSGTGEPLALDFREVAPAAATREMFLRDGQAQPTLATDGGLAVAVPNAAHGYLALLEKAGTLKRSVVLAPAIRLARNGFRVTPKYQQLAGPRVECLRASPDAARTFLRPDGSGTPDVPPLGTRIRQPELARTLEQLAAKGDGILRRGPLAQALVDGAREAGGILSLEDLARIQVRWRTPLAGTYRGHRVLTFPPPSAGGVAVLQVLGVLEKLRPDGYQRRAPADLHLFIEALRRAYAERSRALGDPDQVPVPTAWLISPQHVAELAGSIDPARVTPSASMAEPRRADGGVPATRGAFAPTDGARNTAHISVMDRWGGAVALTTTLNTWFGSCVVARGTGILLNNQMDDFSIDPGVPNSFGLVAGEINAVAPGRIPVSSMAPTLVFQRDRPARVLLAVGSPGGSVIITTVLQVLTNVLDAQMNLPAAVAAGRFHHQWLPDVVQIDRNSLDPATQSALEAMGHKFRTVERMLGDGQAVMEDPQTGLRTAGSDPRNEGAALGQD